MTQYLPPNLLALFAPRDPIQYLPPLDKLPHEKKFVPYSGVTGVLETFEVSMSLSVCAAMAVECVNIKEWC